MHSPRTSSNEALEAACITGDGAAHTNSDRERCTERRGQETCQDLVKSDLSGEEREVSGILAWRWGEFSLNEQSTPIQRSGSSRNGTCGWD